MTHPIRSFAKAITWRIVATTLSVILIYVVTGDLAISGIIGGLDVILKLVVYYAHERVWNRITWGKKNEKCTDFHEHCPSGHGNNGHHPQGKKIWDRL